MRKIITLAAAFALCATTQAFAIAGIGAHYIMNTGSLDGKKSYAVEETITVDQKSSDGLQGLGFKFWIDLLPIIDIEGTLNIAAARYKTNLIIGDETIPLNFTPGAPYNMLFREASPIFGVFNVDLSITYPFDLPLVRPYIGAGVSYFKSIPVVNGSLLDKMLNPEDLQSLAQQDPNIAEEIGQRLATTLKDESYKTGMGGHIIIGCRITVIPFLKPYVNGKYYFGGNTNSQFTQGFVLEVGGGLAL